MPSRQVSAWDLEQSPFHAGELEVQERVGVRAKMETDGRRSIRRVLTEQHMLFFPLLPYVFVGCVDASGQPWASILLGPPGFVAPSSPTSITVTARPLWGDPLYSALRPGAEIAVLGAQLHTRRRNRVFGAVTNVQSHSFDIDVRQTMGLCPQYIQGREPEFTRDPLKVASLPVHRATSLDKVSRSIIEGADTFFVASANSGGANAVARGTDVSHKGGRPGFVRVDNDGLITTPDFVGNFVFNTLGNFLVDNRAGLLFLDFKHGDLLYIAASASIVWEGPEVRAFAGAQRLVRYSILQVIRVEKSLPARFSPPQNSPLLARTGTWLETARALDAEKTRDEWRPFRIARSAIESSDITSFYLEPADGRGLAPYAPGQFLPIRVKMPSYADESIRTYTLSGASNASSYRITVKRQGNGGVSDFLHSAVASANTGPDLIIEARSPRGKFTLDADPMRSIVFVSSGIGVTPFIAMLDSLLVNNARTRHLGPLWFIHGTRNSTTHAFASFIKDKETLNSPAVNPSRLRTHICYSQPLPTDDTFDSEGRVDIALLKAVLPFDDHEFYLCGLPAFMQSLYDGLIDLGVRDSRIHFEAFGPSSVIRKRRNTKPISTSESCVVEFSKSRKKVSWKPEQGSLLDLSEAAGVAPLSSCRSGICGTCHTRIVKGNVEYAEPPTHDIEDGEALICIATPIAASHDPKDENISSTADLIIDL